MAALNIPLITWCIIVAAMTVLISVRLFRKERTHVHAHHHHGHVLEMGKEREEFFIPGDRISKRDDAINDIDY